MAWGNKPLCEAMVFKLYDLASSGANELTTWISCNSRKCQKIFWNIVRHFKWYWTNEMYLKSLWTKWYREKSVSAWCLIMVRPKQVLGHLQTMLTRFLSLIWVKSRNCGCLVTWFCYQLIAKPGNKTATVPWPDPVCTRLPLEVFISYCPNWHVLDGNLVPYR